MKKYLVEFIGMFLFVLTVGMVVIGPGIGDLAPLAIGSVSYTHLDVYKRQF